MHHAILFGPTPVLNAPRLKRHLQTRWRVHEAPSLPATLSPAEFGDVSAVIGMTVPSEWLPHLTALRLVQGIGAGVDSFNLDALPNGSTLCNVYEHEIPIAEYVMGAILHTALRIDRYDGLLRRGIWEGSGRLDGIPHAELCGQTVGIIGYGHIGRAVARRARAFDMKVLAIRSKRTGPGHGPGHGPGDDDLWAEWIGGPEDVADLLAKSDYVVIACPLTPATRGWIDASLLKTMRPSAYLVNVSRAEIVVESDLYQHLKEGRIAGAVLDVWYRYPGSADELLHPSYFDFHRLDNVWMTPHFSAWTEPMIERRWRLVAENLDRLARGEPLKNVVFTR